MENRGTCFQKLKMSQEEVPFVLVTVFRNEKEILKKAVHVQNLGELESLIREQCPSLQGCALERTLVYCKIFEEYLDTTDHTPQMHDRFQLRFSTTPCISVKDTKVIRDTSECALSCKTVDSSVPLVPQYHSTISGDVVRPTVIFQEGKVQDSKVTQRASVKNDSVNTMSDLSKEETQRLSRIYGKGKSDETLTKYQSEINNHAYLVALENPFLLRNRGELMAEARKRLHAAGYKYKRANSSRSKVFGKGSPPNVDSGLKYKNARFLNERLIVIREEVQSMEKELQLYEQGREKSVEGGLYGEGAKFEELARELRKKLWTLKAEENGISQKILLSLKRKRKPMNVSFENSEIRRKLHFTNASNDTCTFEEDSVAVLESTATSTECRVDHVDAPVVEEGLYCVATM